MTAARTSAARRESPLKMWDVESPVEGQLSTGERQVIQGPRRNESQSDSFHNSA